MTVTNCSGMHWQSDTSAHLGPPSRRTDFMYLAIESFVHLSLNAMGRCTMRVCSTWSLACTQQRQTQPRRRHGFLTILVGLCSGWCGTQELSAKRISGMYSLASHTS